MDTVYAAPQGIHISRLKICFFSLVGYDIGIGRESQLLRWEGRRVLLYVAQLCGLESQRHD